MSGGELPLKSRCIEANRNSEIFAALQPKLVLVSKEVVSEVIPDWSRVSPQPLILQLELDASGSHSISLPEIASKPTDPMCYMLTGGTTGASKVVEVTHAMSLHEVQAYPDVAPWLTCKDRVLQHTPVLWAASALGQVDIALAFGATMCITSAADQETITLAAQRCLVSSLVTGGFRSQSTSSGPLHFHLG